MVSETCLPGKAKLRSWSATARYDSGAKEDAVLCPQQSSLRRTLRNRPARLGRYRDGPNAGSLTRSLSA